MSFVKAVRSGFSNYFSVKGRANRREFWFWFAFAVIVLLSLIIVDGALIGPARGYLPFEHEAGRPLTRGVLVFLLLPTITAAIRRLHDSDLSGWWLLLVFTGIGLVPVLYLLIKNGKKGSNRFGT